MAKHSSILIWRTTDGGAWWAMAHRVTKSRRWLTRLSTHTAHLPELLIQQGWDGTHKFTFPTNVQVKLKLLMGHVLRTTKEHDLTTVCCMKFRRQSNNYTRKNYQE